MKYEKEFREAHPETIGETEMAFDMGNYINWLEKEHEALKQVNNNNTSSNVINCSCTPDETTGTTTVKCCNICGKPAESWWRCE